MNQQPDDTGNRSRWSCDLIAKTSPIFVRYGRVIRAAMRPDIVVQVTQRPAARPARRSFGPSTASRSNCERISSAGRNSVRVARMAASSTACLARLKPKKSRSRPAVDHVAQDLRALVAIVERGHLQRIPAAGAGQNLSLDARARLSSRAAGRASPTAAWAISSTSSVT